MTSARMLLEAGADPNAGYLWHGLPTPFTVLTGVFGEGELGPVRQPRHPHSLALARLLIVWAAAHGKPGSVELLAGLGFDVNARGRSDAPDEDPWQTALHVAAMEGHLSLARSLLRLGADPDIRDHRFELHPARLGSLFRPGTARRAARTADCPGRTRRRCRGTRFLITRRPGG